MGYDDYGTDNHVIETDGGYFCANTGAKMDCGRDFEDGLLGSGVLAGNFGGQSSAIYRAPASISRALSTSASPSANR